MWKMQITVEMTGMVKSNTKPIACNVIRTSGCEFDADEITSTLNRTLYEFGEDIK